MRKTAFNTSSHTGTARTKRTKSKSTASFIQGSLFAKDLDEATYQLLGLARREDEKAPNIRCIYHDNALWLDLGGKDWDGVRVTADGWEVITRLDAPILRGGGIRALPRPERGGDISHLREFANVRDDEDFVLFCGSTAALLNPFGDYTTTVFCGPAGSGKTTATLVMRGLVDPHKANTRTMTTVRDLMTGAGNTHIVGLENVSHISAGNVRRNLPP